MSYLIKKTDGNALITPSMPNGVLQDGTKDETTGLTLIGRDFPNYGELQNTNFVRLLENFASDIPPGQSVGFSPISGTLWWDTGAQRLKIYNGTSFISVSPLVESATAPAAHNIGDQWWDTTNDQLSTWTGAKWQLIGPLATRGQGKSGPYVESVLDNTAVTHTIVTEYVNGTVVSVSSGDSFILGAPTYGFTTIQQGINLPGNKVVEGNAYVGGFSTLGDDVVINGQLILSRLTNGIVAPTAAMVPGTNNTYDIGTTTSRFRNIYTSGNIVLTDANIYFANKSLVVNNRNYGGNVEIYVNAITGNTQAINFNGSDGLATVAGNPTRALGIATKGYTDTAVATVIAGTSEAIDLVNANVAALQTQLNNDVLSLVATIEADVAAINATDNATSNAVNNLSIVVADNQVSNDVNFANVYVNYDNVNSALTRLAPLDSPTFTGSPRVPTVGPTDNSTVVATTEFVTRAGAALATDYNIKISGLTSSTSANLTAGLGIKANINSPVFTGTPTAPYPTDTNSNQLATTQFVTATVNAQKFNYTVSANPPSGGNNGDFWFQIG